MSTPPQDPGRRLAVVLLAAGLGRRMGGPNKLLCDLEGMPVVRRAALPFRAALPADAPRVVVTGRDAAKVTAALDGLGFSGVYNPDFSDGMGRSIAAGVAALPADVDGILIALGDMPGLQADTVHAMRAALSADLDPASAILRPMHDGHAGHPVLWGADYRSALAALTGDRGGRDLILQHAGRLRQVVVDDPAVIRDIDQPSDLAAARALFTTDPAGKQWS
ncbi:nucleotidyltransferase family protein [Roseospira navarrensis]|uniref:NTP transferase domain-containing protein n=1 Tax=Roseospira navarrensis TaxID=140058 RepID=A0A7X1ZFR2_9PROT|nr:nucleotidyltransferase family protein [Roseospira navarrensis]MQX36572.1 NTP transferase domain-containing protein [Roseospira navarrensis]